MKSLPWTPVTPQGPRLLVARLLVATVLRALSRALDRMSHRLVAMPQRPRPAQPLTAVEFHAEAGAPEGALYVDGQLVGRLPGVTRL
jgi:hypothetical protein